MFGIRLFPFGARPIFAGHVSGSVDLWRNALRLPNQRRPQVLSLDSLRACYKCFSQHTVKQAGGLLWILSPYWWCFFQPSNKRPVGLNLIVGDSTIYQQQWNQKLAFLGSTRCTFVAWLMSLIVWMRFFCSLECHLRAKLSIHRKYVSSSFMFPSYCWWLKSCTTWDV